MNVSNATNGTLDPGALLNCEHLGTYVMTENGKKLTSRRRTPARLRLYGRLLTDTLEQYVWGPLASARHHDVAVMPLPNGRLRGRDSVASFQEQEQQKYRHQGRRPRLPSRILRIPPRLVSQSFPHNDDHRNAPLADPPCQWTRH